MYNLDFETMMHAMQEHQKTGFLHTDMVLDATGSRESCHIEVKIQEGLLVSCSIVGSSSKHIITGKKAIQALLRLARLKWTFTLQQENVAPSSSFSAETEEFFLLPRRTVQIRQEHLRTWSRMHRAVFALADGTRSIMKIAEVLSTSPDQVSKTLNALKSIGVIVMEPQSEKDRSGYL